MKLTLHTDYALRMLMFLAVQERGPVTVSDVADSYGLSRNHLLKVALNLGRLGYLTTTRGRSGGIALALPPENINIGDVVRGMEDGFALVECMRPDGGTCVITSACRLRVVMREATQAFLSVFDRYTLADLSQNEGELSAILEKGSSPPDTTATS
ncbi:RrF2 family transcriptional regulator [Pararhizobium haloflavum]|uniref:RrF2 family transcriptional regulator n=1 Tax=Pararhizobium haloflavum TaxID=2037914 RepID=UPI000C1A45B3|nr:Rrf2 family transcriptional regulator [Pararhizobium haloflavum]